MGNPEVDARWQRVKAEVDAAVAGQPSVVARIPGWEPADIAAALRWLQVHIYEGYYVGWMVEATAGEGVVIWVKEWEYGDDEPGWEEIKRGIPAT